MKAITPFELNRIYDDLVWKQLVGGEYTHNVFYWFCFRKTLPLVRN